MIMKNVDEESNPAEEGKDESILPNEERLRCVLEDLHGLVGTAEEYVSKVAVSCLSRSSRVGWQGRWQMGNRRIALSDVEQDEKLR